MRRIIVASICSLVVSLFGVFGSGQIPIDNIASIENKQNVTKEQVTQTTSEENKTANEVSTETETITQALLRSGSDKVFVNNKVTDQVTTDEITTDEVVTDKVATDEVIADEVATDEVIADQVTTEQVAEVASQKVAYEESEKATYTPVASDTQNVFYKNVDLSNCDTASEVISQLKANGCTVVNQNNEQSFKSVEDIISYVQKYDGGNCTFNKQNNATAPVATAPVATAPVATAPVATAPVATAPVATAPVATAPVNTAPVSTAPVVTAPAATNTTTSTSSYANQVLELVNQERAKGGLSALSMTAELNNAASTRAEETVQSFSHTRPNGTSFSTVLQEYGISYRTCGENLAYGQKTPQEVVTGWMNSPGHRANIMNGSFGKIGIGVYTSNGVTYWSQLFTN